MCRQRLRCILTAAALFSSLSALQADTTFYTEGWSSANSNWTVAAGTPYYGGLLRNASSNLLTVSRLLYAGTLTSQDYSITSFVNCGSHDPNTNYYPMVVHYLRASGGNYYRLRAQIAPPDQNGVSFVSIQLERFVTGASTVSLGYAENSCTYNSTLRTATLSGNITVQWGGATVLSANDSTLTSGSLGAGTFAAPEGYGVGFGSTTLAYTDTTPPSTPGNLAVNAVYATQVNLSWTASTDNTAVAGYYIYRDGVNVGSTATTSFSDVTVLPSTTYSYTVKAYDHGQNLSAAAGPVPATTPSYTYSAPAPGGPVEFSATYGAGPEQIAISTGTLGLRVPLLSLKHRTRGPGLSVPASWNSGMWHWDSGGGTRMTAMDTGYGLGFNYLAGGGVFPVYSGSTLVRFEFQDVAGVVHRLEPTGTPDQYRSQDSTYLLWDNALRKLYFRDGTVWLMDCISRAPEPDAGTRYPTELKDSNGNRINIEYKPASGWSAINTSARIAWIRDTVTKYTWVYSPVNSVDHVTRIYHSDPTGQDTTQYTDVEFVYVTRSDIVSPFGAQLPGQPLTVVLLSEIKFTGAVGPYKMDYNTSAEVTKLTLPYRGYFRYEYLTASFSNGARQAREIQKRYLRSDMSGSGTEQVYEFQHPSADQSNVAHTQTTLLDAAQNKKVWNIVQGAGSPCPVGSRGWDNGLVCVQETWQGPSTFTLLESVRTDWTQDDPATNAPMSNPRPATVTSTLSDGLTSSKRETTVDANGNVAVVKEYSYSDATTPYRTTALIYETGSTYTSRNILNRVKEVRVCAGNSTTCSTPESLVTTTYDQFSIAAYPSGTAQWDSSYGSVTQRGNPTTINNNGIATTLRYDAGGNLTSSTDATGAQHTAVYSTVNYTSRAILPAAGSLPAWPGTWTQRCRSRRAPTATPRISTMQAIGPPVY